jgi:hypothetical protein
MRALSPLSARPSAKVPHAWSASGAAAFCLLLAMSGCEPGPAAAECQAPCARQTPACAACPAIATELCVEGQCQVRPTDEVGVTVSVSLPRGTDDVTGLFVVALAAVSPVGRVGCDFAFDDINDQNILAGRLFNASGGTFHPDLSLGQTPRGELVVYAGALNGAGALVGEGCLPSVAATPPSVSVPVLNVLRVD